MCTALDVFLVLKTVVPSFFSHRCFRVELTVQRTTVSSHAIPQQ